ncbi:MAG: transporter [Herminiimonas sp.]|nr:transporter [Herminiimonas sp.]
MQWQAIRKSRIVPLALIGLLLPIGSSTAADLVKKGSRKTVDQQLAESEARVRILQERVDRLESRLNAMTPELRAQSVPSAGRQPASAQSSPPATQVQSAAATSPSSTVRSAPGTFEVDEAAAQRALERTLTQSGALLLRAGTFELTPSLNYSRSEQSSQVLATIVNPQTGSPALVLANQATLRNEFTPRLDMRMGLPSNSQLEISLPYQYVRSRQTSTLGTETSDSANGLGDLSVGIAKTLTREKAWQPDIIGRLNYNFGTGRQQDASIILGSGYRQLQAEVVALKRQDPLAFTASASYAKVFEKDGIKPGDATILSLGAVLAASPATSLQLAFSQIYRQKQEQNGIKIAGSDQTYGVISLGASSVLSRDMTLVTQFGIGVGRDAPRYNIGIALPILFR